ncbi:hypothetical protein M0802_005860 [Mischocyttarus mexicanus]|nr:hypothetical protein M0802_005860 [Mischocyttarus mexicanus]
MLLLEGWDFRVSEGSGREGLGKARGRGYKSIVPSSGDSSIGQIAHYHYQQHHYHRHHQPPHQFGFFSPRGKSPEEVRGKPFLGRQIAPHRKTRHGLWPIDPATCANIRFPGNTPSGFN